jgi:hypothetical protein
VTDPGLRDAEGLLRPLPELLRASLELRFGTAVSLGGAPRRQAGDADIAISP